MAVIAIVALLAWIGTLPPGAQQAGAQQASAQSSFEAPRLGSEFVALHDEHDDEHEHDNEHDGHEGEEGDEEYEEDHEHDEEDDDWDEEEWEQHHAYAEFHRTDLELRLGKLRIVDELTEIAKDPEAAAVLAIVNVVEEVDDLEAQAKILSAMLDEADSETVKRTIRVMLAQTLSEMQDYDRALAEVRRLVANK